MSEQSERKRVILSGIQPTGTFTLGNYIGAVRNWAKLQDEFDCLYMVADLHALTVRQDPAALRRHSREAAAMILASGVDPKRSILFVQSHVPAHTQLNWIFCCNAQFGELSRMTQFKDKSAKHPDNVNGGLFTYPALMAADILIYNAELVPVGQDQTQHLELARNIAQRFNNNYSPTFVMPEGYVTKEGAKIMSLADPTRKMSKSDTNVNAFILLTDDRDTITRKFKRAPARVRGPGLRRLQGGRGHGGGRRPGPHPERVQPDPGRQGVCGHRPERGRRVCFPDCQQDDPEGVPQGGPAAAVIPCV